VVFPPPLCNGLYTALMWRAALSDGGQPYLTPYNGPHAAGSLIWPRRQVGETPCGHARRSAVHFRHSRRFGRIIPAPAEFLALATTKRRLRVQSRGLYDPPSA
jgi:hypothetical protein